MHRHRYSVLDSYRFIAALGVVLFHFENHLSPLHGYPTNGLDRFQTFVDFFFVLSGFVLMHTYGYRIRTLPAYGDFLRKRIARIYPLQFATLLLCVAIAAFVAVRHVQMHDRSIVRLDLLPAHILLIHAWGVTDTPGLNFPSWSISAEAFVYLLFPVFALILSRIGPARTIIVAVVIAVAMEIIRAALGLRSGFLATFDAGMIRAVPTFLAGMAVCHIVEARPASPLSWRYPTALGVVILVLIVVKAPTPLIIACYPLLVGLIATADRGGRPTLLATPFFVRLGDASFAMYMLHTFIETPSVGIARKLGLTSVAALCGVAAVGTLIIIGLSLLSFRFFETPCRRLIAGSRRRARSPLPGDPLAAATR